MHQPFASETVEHPLTNDRAASAALLFYARLTLTFIVQNGEKKEKSISRSTVQLGFQKYLEVLKEDGSVTGPKKLGVFGASYLLPLFQRFYKP